MPLTRSRIEYQLSDVKVEISMITKEINDVDWEILQLQAKGRAANAIGSSPNFGDEEKRVALQQRAEFLREEVQLEMKRDKLRTTLAIRNAKRARLERELQSMS
jgi:hypothetical protein